MAMVTWLEFVAAVGFFTLICLFFWCDVAEWFELSQQEALLAELWAEEEAA